MTATPTIRPQLEHDLPDVRCGCSLGSPSEEQGRCQLFSGHEGPHAVMYSAGGRRRVRSWIAHDVTSTRDCEDEIAGRPWMFGYPLPAWIVVD